MRDDKVRPRMARYLDRPIFGKRAWVMCGPIPEPPPVMRITFPAVDNSGREESINGWVWRVMEDFGVLWESHCGVSERDVLM